MRSCRRARGQRAEGRQPARRGDHRERPVLRVELGGGRGDRVGQVVVGHPRRPGPDAGRAHRLPGRGRGPARGEHLGGDLHDLGRGAVVDGQLLRPPVRAEMRGRAPRPSWSRRRASRSGRRRRPASSSGWGSGAAAAARPSPTAPAPRRRSRARTSRCGRPRPARPSSGCRAPPGARPAPRRRAGRRRCSSSASASVSASVRAGPVQHVEGLLGLPPPALLVAPGRGPRGGVVDAEQFVGLLQQRDVGRGPRGRRRPQQQVAVGVGPARRRRDQPLPGREQVAQQPLRGEPRPQPVDQRVHSRARRRPRGAAPRRPRRRAGSPRRARRRRACRRTCCASRSMTRRANAGRASLCSRDAARPRVRARAASVGVKRSVVPSIVMSDRCVEDGLPLRRRRRRSRPPSPGGPSPRRPPAARRRARTAPGRRPPRSASTTPVSPREGSTSAM